MAPEQAAGQRVDERADLYASRSCSTRRSRARTRSAPARRRRPRAASAPCCPPLRRARKDLPPELCAAIDRALRPRPDERGTLDDLADALADALPEVSDEGGTVAPPPARAHRAAPLPRGVGRAGRRARRRRPRWPRALAWAGQPVAAGARRRRSPSRAAAAPRLARRRPRRRSSLLAARAARAPRVARRRRGRCPSRCCCAAAAAWSLPALAPLLGLATLAGAYPALAGRAPRWPAARRARARSAPGGRCSPRRCWSGALARRRRDPPCAAGVDGAPVDAARARAAAHQRRAALRRRLGARGAVLPWLVRGRWLAARRRRRVGLGGRARRGDGRGGRATGAPEPRGLVLATFVARPARGRGPHLRRVAVVEP